MSYSSPNAPEVRDVLGTWLLSILDRQKRYAHVSCLRGDAVATEILKARSAIGEEYRVDGCRCNSVQPLAGDGLPDFVIIDSARFNREIYG